MKQSLKWQSSLDMNFIDFEKTLDSISRDVLPRLSRHYVMPDKVVTILRGLYESFSSQVVHTGQRTQPLNMKTGVREVCRQSALQTSQKENNNRIPFTLIFFNLPNHSKQHMVVCGLSLHQGSTESRKTLEQKFIFSNRHS